MACRPIWIGFFYKQKHETSKDMKRFLIAGKVACRARCMYFSALLTALAFLLLLPVRALAADPLPYHEAFVLSAQMQDEQTIALHFAIRPGYYLYGDKFAVSAPDAQVQLGEAARPAGVVHDDVNFGRVETYRDALTITVPLLAAPASKRLQLEVASQGCWDGGICYPPDTQPVTLDLDDIVASSAAGIAPAVASSPAASGGEDESGQIAGLFQHSAFGWVLLSFFGFGLLLAFTPCVFPMIPILSGIIVGQGTSISRWRAFFLSLAYVIGMALTYALAGVAAGFSGNLISASLQNVWVLGFFALVFVGLACAMFGLYELQVPAWLQNRLNARVNRVAGGQFGGVFVMGVLSALIVGPCVAAPLAGALLYIAQSGDAVRGGLALFVMALGMGVPLLFIGVAARTLLPSSGAWMDAVKHAFGMLLLAMAIWIISPFAPAWLMPLGLGVLLVFWAATLGVFNALPAASSMAQRLAKAAGFLLLLYGAALIIGVLAGSRDILQPLAALRTGSVTQQATSVPAFDKIHSVAELEQRLAAAGRQVVMLDFYADWCVSCKEMERFTFSDPQVAAQMQNFVLLKADVTANNAEDRALLQRFGLFGPPGILFFDHNGDEIKALRVVGYKKADSFLDTLQQVSERASALAS